MSKFELNQYAANKSTALHHSLRRVNKLENYIIKDKLPLENIPVLTKY